MQVPPTNVLPSTSTSSSSKKDLVPIGKRAIDILARKEPIPPPKLGMRFDTMDEAYEYYLAYGYRNGFGVTKRNFHTRNGVRYRYTLMCYKGGKPKNKPGLKVRRRLVAKTDCKAVMVVKFNNLQGNWEVVFLELEHNHPCNPEMVRFMMCFKDLPDWKKEYQPFNARTRLHPKIHAGRGRPARPKEYVERTLGQRGFSMDMGKWRFTEADVEALLAFFDRNHQDPSFFYSWDMDEAGRLKNVCWVDPRSREAFKYFGDVVSFDTVYLTEQYVIPLVAFLGVSHHGQVILLGCGLLGDESVETYVWLFKKWLKFMDDRPPGAVITSHTGAVVHAVTEAFPSARRRFNLWQILKDLPELSGRTEDKEAMSMRVRKVVFGSLTGVDFERDWMEMIKQYGLAENRWLAALFEERDKWVPAYIKETFWAGLGTMHRSERLDHFFDGYITPETTIKGFIEQYDTAMRLRYDREMYDDFRSLQQCPDMLSGLLFEEQIAKIYTINMFLKFQDQVRQLVRVNCKETNRTGSMVTYTVTVIGKGKKLDYRVVFNSSEKEVWCICRSFQFKGILCSHSLAVLKQELVMHIPNKYILDRWKKDYNRPHEQENNKALSQPDSPAQLPYHDEIVVGSDSAGEERENEKGNDPLYQHGNKFLAELAELGSLDEDGMEYALSVMKEAREKIMKKFEESKGGGSKSGIASTSGDKEEKGKKERTSKKGKKNDRGSSSGVKEGSESGAAANPLVTVAAPPGIFYLPVGPHQMVYPPFPPSMPLPVPPVMPVPVATEKAKKRKKRRRD
ncbi:Protein FAR1-RELATED SEQUENCE 6 [Rhynchospora pubera]|uniref:Protein FAR1-RELATED SEQUENCE n=1 Tax=Rhynchospora pubera TaxID=906938 RepID=A0AAV8FXN1_9POAL|nr:Protein FAR1-RELATED SEQUENCE 6 [Rhynchospora pubera]